MRRYIFSLCGLVVAFFVFSMPVVQADNLSAGPIIINEIMWDGDEYIELFNPTDQPVNLNGWRLTRQAPGSELKTIIQFSDGDHIAAAGYYLLVKKDTAVTVPIQKVLGSLTLLNTGEQLTLVADTGTISDVANPLGAWVAGANTTNGQAMERNLPTTDGTVATSWHTATTTNGGRDGSPGMANSQSPVNVAPTAVLSGETIGVINVPLTFSAEDSTDPEDADLQYVWDFGDGTTTATTSDVSHTFTKAGIFTVSLTVSDGSLTNQVTKSVTITAPHYNQHIVISEILPNPAGSDTTAEFIELQNLESTSVDMSGWQLDDAEAGSVPYTLPAGTTMPAHGLSVFTRATTKLALNNSGDSARLLDPTGKVVSSFTYTDTVAENVSYNRVSDNQYQLSTTTTPGLANVITSPASEVDGESDDSSTSTTTSTKTKTGQVAGTEAKAVDLENIRDEEPGTIITTTGVVSVPPGVLGDNIMYLAGSGIQLYLSSGQWPELKLGDRVQVTGELSSIQDEARLKISQAADITKQGSTAPPEPHQVKTGDISESWEGSLVIIQGHVTETSGDTFYVDDDSGAVKVAIKESTGIKKPKMKKGDAVTITGVVSQTSSGYRILPRFQEDVRLGLVAGLTTFPKSGAFSLEEILVTTLWELFCQLIFQ